jgi:cell division protein ZapA (FtsZ GTPase activity inhibitor)
MAIEEKNKKNKYYVNIMGEELKVVGNVSRDYIDELVSYINEIGGEIVKAYPRLPRRRIIGLAMINISDEHHKLKKEYMQQLVISKKLDKQNRDLREELKKLREDYEEVVALLEEAE